MAGQGRVREYFRWAEANDWRTDGAPFPETAGIDVRTQTNPPSVHTGGDQSQAPQRGDAVA